MAKAELPERDELSELEQSVMGWLSRHKATSPKDIARGLHKTESEIRLALGRLRDWGLIADDAPAEDSAGGFVYVVKFPKQQAMWSISKRKDPESERRAVEDARERLGLAATVVARVAVFSRQELDDGVAEAGGAAEFVGTVFADEE